MKYNIILGRMFFILAEYSQGFGYRESKDFKDAVKCYKTKSLKDIAFLKRFISRVFTDKSLRIRSDACKHLRYTLLPFLQKDRVRIERKKEKRLSFLAEILDKLGRLMEVHMVRVIVKPNIRNLNLKWKNMPALEKAKTVLDCV